MRLQRVGKSYTYLGIFRMSKEKVGGKMKKKKKRKEGRRSRRKERRKGEREGGKKLLPQIHSDV